MNVLERFQSMDYGPAPEARNEADAWLQAKDFSRSLFIGGSWQGAAGGATFDTNDPASGGLLATVSDAQPADVEAAVAAAARALPRWSARTGFDRARIIYAIGRAMQRHARLMA